VLPSLDQAPGLDEAELIAQELSGPAERMSELEKRLGKRAP